MTRWVIHWGMFWGLYVFFFLDLYASANPLKWGWLAGMCWLGAAAMGECIREIEIFPDQDENLE